MFPYIYICGEGEKRRKKGPIIKKEITGEIIVYHYASCAHQSYILLYPTRMIHNYKQYMYVYHTYAKDMNNKQTFSLKHVCFVADI